MKDGKDCKLHSDVERVLKDFHRSRKPIGYVSFGHTRIQSLSTEGAMLHNSNNSTCVQSIGLSIRAAACDIVALFFCFLSLKFTI